MPMSVRFVKITAEEYLDFEERATQRHEFVDGQIHAMTADKRSHHLIAMRLLSQAYSASQSRPHCQVFASAMKLYVAGSNCIYYPDIFASCDPTDRDDAYATSACFIAEVLSPSTVSIDRREKRMNYQAMPSLKEYVIVSQDRLRVEIYQREETGWIGYLLQQPDDIIWSSCLGLRMTLADLYQDVELPPLGVAEEAPAYESGHEPILWLAQPA